MACPVLTSSPTPWFCSAKRAGTVKVDRKSHILLQHNLIPGDIRVLRLCKLAAQWGFANSTRFWPWLLAHEVGWSPRLAGGPVAPRKRAAGFSERCPEGGEA